MQVFSSDVYFTVGTNALLASQKEYYSDLVALVKSWAFVRCY